MDGAFLMSHRARLRQPRCFAARASVAGSSDERLRAGPSRFEATMNLMGTIRRFFCGMGCEKDSVGKLSGMADFRPSGKRGNFPAANRADKEI